MHFKEAIGYLESFPDYERIANYPYKKSFDLDRVRSFLETLDNPHRDLRCIHIAGTKGKGSTAAFVAYILREAGFKVGLYTSPHLNSFRERIRILGQKLSAFAEALSPSASADAHRSSKRRWADFEGMVSEENLSIYTDKIRSCVKKFSANSEFSPLTFFEVYTALALLYFKEKDVDFAVLETGLGGRLDATNVVDPLVCGITQISLEHTQLLGHTLEQIAAEKVGIIKQKGQIVVSSPQEKQADRVIQRRCDEYQAKLYRVGKDINFIEGSFNQEHQVFDAEGLFNKYANLKIKLLGRHQLVNATTAIGIIELMRNFNINISKEKIREGLEATIWPGRFEIINKAPYIVLDGAQNIASVNALKETLNRIFGSKNKVLVLGISKDKDIEGMCRILGDISDRVILTQADNPRAADPNILHSFIKRDKIIGITSSVKEAIDLVKKNVKKEDIIVVTGSLFLVGEARKILKSY
ncbi:MAG: bifunctional folylpolyglutamate synthase/dihydrofolate synthase [Candidatus Omnitrophica bacterium]|nr:bifunctional folylpolyglutamate synthase/dihydrofolate synthase [Candidatus Omnitrophota bacterium]